jgi:hypothetical protein
MPSILDEFTDIQSLPSTSSFRFAKRDDVNMKGLHSYFPRALKQLVKNYNGHKKKQGRKWEGITQLDAANFCSFHGIGVLQTIKGFKKLRSVDRIINQIGSDEDIETWIATVNIKTKGFTSGKDRWVGKMFEEIKSWYFSVAGDFHLPASIVLQVGMSCVLMQASPHLVRQEYRDEFKKQIFSFAEWIAHRNKEGKEIIRKIRRNRNNEKQRPLIYQIDWERDVLEVINKR